MDWKDRRLTTNELLAAIHWTTEGVLYANLDADDIIPSAATHTFK